MKGEERRKLLTDIFGEADEPLSASVLAQRCGVSRQVIVQDIALLRAAGEPIVSTHRGYVLSEKKRVERVFKALHGDEQIEDELSLIVSLGGRVEDVSVNHRIYGTLSAELGIGNMVQVREYMRSMAGGASRPLNSVTGGYHYHTVSADSEETLDRIGKALKERGYFVEK